MIPNKKEKRELIDFSKLSKHELSLLTSKWERDVLIVEMQLQKAVNAYNKDPEKITRLDKICQALWRRVTVLEKWKQRNAK